MTRSFMGLGKGMAITAAALLVVVACGGNTPTTSVGPTLDYKPVPGTNGGQLVYSDWEPVQDLNVMSSTAQTTQQATNVIWSSLWAWTPKSIAYPDIVSDVPTVANGMVKQVDSTHMDVTIKVKSGLKWSDGSPLTSADVQFTIEAICDPSTGAAAQIGYDHIASMEAKDAQTLILHFGPNTKGKCGLGADLASGIYAPFLSAMDVTVMPKSALSSVKHADWATSDYFTKKPTVTSGPYMVQDFTPGPAAQVVMVPNPHYADGRGGAQFLNHKPYLDKLIYKIYGDKAGQIAGLKAGDADLGFDLIAKDLPAVQTITADKTDAATGYAMEYLTMNEGNNTTGCDAQLFAATCGKPSIFKDDVPLRQAVDLAIDKDAMNTQLVGGIGKVMNGPLVSATAPFADTTIPAFKRDVAKANTLLDGDGWVKAADGTRSKAGKKLQWVIRTTSSNSQRASEEELMISNWKEIGATVTVANVPAGTFFNDFKGGGTLATGQYDMGMFTNTFGPDPDSWCGVAQTDQIPTNDNPAGQNWGRISDPKLDTLCKQGSSEIDLTKRVTIYKDMQSEWRNYAATIQLYERPEVFTYATYFKNLFPTVNLCLGVCNAVDWFRGKS
jgi:peptide/nickel transport system substrate-binding protein